MSSTLKFASTKKIEIASKSNVIDMPTAESMLADNKLTKCVIVSAFTDIEWIKKIVDILDEKASKKGSLVQFFLDRGASKYRLNKIVLDNLSTRIKNSFGKDSGIYLISCSSLFHSKLFYFESLTNIKLAIGSINFTQKAFENNEEIALIEDYRKPPIIRSRSRKKSKRKREHKPAFIEPVQKYISCLSKQSTLIPYNFGCNYQTLRNRLLDGYLYRRTNEIDPFIFHLNLSKEILKRLSERGKKDNSNFQSVDKYLKDLKENSISIKKLLGHIENDASSTLTKKERAKLKKYSIESSYGFWVPREYNKIVNDSLKNSTQNKRIKIENSIKDLNKAADIEKGFKAFLYAMMESLKIQGQDRLKDSDQKTIKRLEISWQKWFSTLQKKFCIPHDAKKEFNSNELDACKKLKEKLSSNLFGYPMPNLWDDAEAAEEFESSILESIEYSLSRVGNKPTIINDLIGDNICDTEDDIKLRLTNHEFSIPKKKKKSNKKR